MTTFKSYKTLMQATMSALITTGLVVVLQPGRVLAGPTAAATTPAPTKYKITGAELYSIHCNRCHPERYPTERTSAQWKTIMLHMQVRANIPNQQSRLILKYLQDNSGR